MQRSLIACVPVGVLAKPLGSISNGDVFGKSLAG
jgi:hypothetical protein